ncbi:MAG: polysaccharide deacetylase family protein [Candidatus Erginobacter occultus]|nr:polysaccharide deacetylase family protein [Candidatus Erginobacter occultus]
MKVGLRIDVDTLDGARRGFPQLLSLFADHGINGSFFLSLGPDNMGRNIWRLLRPDFLNKIIRTRAPKLYGWKILLRGTFWPGPLIWKTLVPHLRRLTKEGHEVGLHAWDHHLWQARAERMTREEIRDEIAQGMDRLTALTNTPTRIFAVPGWKGTNTLLELEETFELKYGSDCRGRSIFLPVIGGRKINVPQVPVTLPTYDEVIGRNGVTEENFNDYLFSLLKPDRLNVLTVHAEVEGMSCRHLFEDFIRKATKYGVSFVPLGSLLPDDCRSLTGGAIGIGRVEGREGWVAVQE